MQKKEMVRQNVNFLKKEKVRQNVNFLEYPLWFQDKDLAESSSEGFIWKDIEGYVFRSGYKVPTKTDAIFLLYFLLQCQKEGHSTELTLSRYQVLKDCGLSIDSKWYKRLQESLDRWLRVDIAFQGKFYDGREYQHIAFHIIDAWSIDKESKLLKIRFSPQFLDMMKGRGFFKYINFHEFKSLHSPLATRLYEILSKSFEKRDVWEIDAEKLASKIPMNERFPARIIPKIRAAVDRINKKTESYYDLEIRCPERGKAILSFHKINKSTNCSIKNKNRPLCLPDNEEFNNLIALLPKGMQEHKTILETISKACDKMGHKYVARNIKYSTRNAKTGYRSYLAKALKNDYGLADEEDQEAKKKKADLRTAEQEAIIRKRQQEEEMCLHEKNQFREAMAKFQTLPKEEQERITNSALATFDATTKQYIQQKKAGGAMALNSTIAQIMSIEEGERCKQSSEE